MVLFRIENIFTLGDITDQNKSEAKDTLKNNPDDEESNRADVGVCGTITIYR